MYLYHVVRSGELEVGQTIDHITDYSDFQTEQIEMINQFYPEGLSGHGIKYLSYYCDHAHNIINVDNTELFSYQCESTLELLRLSSFNDYPSRFQSIFGFKSLEDIWPEFCNENYKIYKIEVSSFDEFDSYYLRSSLISTTSTENGITYPLYGFSHLHALSCLTQYFNQEISNFPKLECVAPLPVVVVEEVIL